MNILFPVAECVPFAKTGGLADVAGALPKSLTEWGHEVHVVMPLYRHVRESGAKLVDSGKRITVPLGETQLTAEIWQLAESSPSLQIYFLRQDNYFDRAELYRGYGDNDVRFVFLCRAALQLGLLLKKKWHIVHCHDWHTGLIPAMLKSLYKDEPAYQKAKSLITIHNLAYQGHFSKETLSLAHLPWEWFHPEGLEFYGGFNFLKAGLIYSDWISTVSQTYAEEIQLSEVGYGLDGVLRSRRDRLSGIVNGIDYAIWDPASDSNLPANFSADHPENKKVVKDALLEATRLLPMDNAPVLGMITRLDDQKGLDIFADALDRLLRLDVQVVILGTGEKKYHDLLLRAKAHHPRKLSIHLEFNNAFAHLIYGGSDMFLMPSKYEPCGLGQLISMKYGSVPIVRHTGGLADTVREFDGNKGTGFLFHHYNGTSLFQTVMRAIDEYHRKDRWSIVMKNGMVQDYSWHRSAAEYVKLYEKIGQA